MNLHELSDKALDENTVTLVKHERELLSRVLVHLREIERRRLFSELGYQSLFDYAVRRLGYSEDQAYRRISAMRLLKEIPQIQEKLERGTLNLSHVGIAQRFFRNEGHSLTCEQKIELFEKMENTSKRNAEKLTFALSALPFQPIEAIRQVSPRDIELRFTAKEELLDKIQILKGLLAHSHPNISLEDLFDKLCELALNKWHPARQKPRAKPKKSMAHQLIETVGLNGVTSSAPERDTQQQH